MKTTYLLKIEEVALENLQSLKGIRTLSDNRLEQLHELRDLFVSNLGHEYVGSFMEASIETPYDEEISILSLSRSYANDSINKIEFVIDNPETTDKNYDGAIC